MTSIVRVSGPRVTTRSQTFVPSQASGLVDPTGEGPVYLVADDNIELRNERMPDDRRLLVFGSLPVKIVSLK
jgi:hypothetical protein